MWCVDRPTGSEVGQAVSPAGPFQRRALPYQLSTRSKPLFTLFVRQEIF
jgi:hypothetical protein